MIFCSRVENNCVSGVEVVWNVVFFVVCGMYDVVLVVGVEKLKDYGSGMLEVLVIYYLILVVGFVFFVFVRLVVRSVIRVGW